jgi:hypothetical protein
MLDGVEVSESKAQKDELILIGNDIQNVSQSGVLPHLSMTYDTAKCSQLPQSRVSAVYGTRIFVNSLTVSTFLIEERLRTEGVGGSALYTVLFLSHSKLPCSMLQYAMP